MNNIFNRDSKNPLTKDELKTLTETEWLVTNGLGGYASTAIGGTLTRVFHGYLIAALPAPLGRTMMLNDVFEDVVSADGRVIPLNGVETENGNYRGATEYLTSFRLDSGLPVWTYDIEGLTIEKRVFLPHRQNTTYINYRVSAGTGSVKLRLRPAVNMRKHESPVNTPLDIYTLTVRGQQYELQCSDGLPPLRMMLIGNDGSFAIDSSKVSDVIYNIERNRGYTWRGDLWSPGYFSIQLAPGQDATLVASTEVWDVVSALSPNQAWDLEHDRKRRLLLESDPKVCGEACHELVWAADQFLFTPVGRREDTARARAAGDEIRSVIAGYHWFTDWGRDTMISLDGLTLVTGRSVEASYILRTFAHYIRDGLIPNLFPEGKKDGLYHTADATLWFFHALHRYIERTNDHHLLKHLLPKLLDIVNHHLRGTRFNIHVDPEDGLLVQGQQGYQLTWMDAKVDDWVVTPRRGKAVEINALWYNALRLMENWLLEDGREDKAKEIREHAEKAKASFNKRFWYKQGGYLYDVVDGENGRNDPACRPNQLFAISLQHPVLDQSRWEAVVKIARERLLTPVGLRSLAPNDKDFKPRYDGDLRARDAAYHQGTVWAWLIGPFVDAWLKVYPNDFKTARTFLDGFQPHLRSACVGSISEIFDAEPPFTPRGCCAQAWSVAEVLRAFVKTSGTRETVEPQPELATATVT
ncbi:MAG: glycogen debranching enzyme family protein [Acidobacteriaceae bacterium]|nr:glycogen debranching enzyme family protein [Acidobacteriaceae bacterium]MBV9766257.1 glycogen debranching enzyme family protein [Acidobacteriaceae bacterium]